MCGAGAGAGGGAVGGGTDISDFGAAHAAEIIVPIIKSIEIEIAIIRFISLSPRLSLYNNYFLKRYETSKVYHQCLIIIVLVFSLMIIVFHTKLDFLLNCGQNNEKHICG